MADISKVRMLNGTEYNYKDAKARSDIEGLKADLADKTLSDDAKNALLDCLRHVGWMDNADGQYLCDILADALGVGISIDITKMGNYSMWKNAYPYYFDAQLTRLEYKDFDVSVVGGGLYVLEVSTAQQNLIVFVNAYNQDVLDAYETQADITVGDHIDIAGGWSAKMKQVLIIPKRINNSPAKGIIIGFKLSDNGNISSNAVRSIKIRELAHNRIPAEYTVYDYIAGAGTNASVTVDPTGYIRTDVYEDLSRVSITLDYLATNDLGSGNLPILGVRGENNWTSVVCIYITGGNSYVIYSHGSETISNVVTKNKSTHLDLRQDDESPTVFFENGTEHEHEWTNSNVVNASLCLFGNPVDGSQNSIQITNNVQLGQFVIGEGDNYDVYVPALRNSDNVIGVYNVTKQRFHTCQDRTKATVGNSNCIYRVGNW